MSWVRDRRFDVLQGATAADRERFTAFGRAKPAELSSQPALSQLMNANPDRLRLMLASALEQPPNAYAIGVVSGLATAAIHAANRAPERLYPAEQGAVHMFSHILVDIRAFEG